MDTEKEIYALSAQTLALETIVGLVLGRLASTSPALHDVIRAGFDDAASHIENEAIRFGKSASPEHTVKALRIVEELRTAVLGNQGKPKGII